MLKKLLYNIKVKGLNYIQQQNILFRVLDFNEQEQEVLMQVKGKNTVFWRNVSEVVSSPNLTGNMSSLDACKIGVFYGQLYQRSQLGKVALKQKGQLPALSSKEHERYNIMYENRNGEITYIDRRERKTYTQYPVKVAENKALIEYFNPLQACYLGVLTGIQMHKRKRSNVVDFLERKERQKKTTLSP